MAGIVNIASIEPDKVAQRIGTLVNGVNDAFRDSAYIAVGFGVLGFQRAQVRRVELAKQLGSLPATVDEWVKPIREQVGGRLDRIEGALPEPARSVVHSARGAAAAQQQLVRGAFGLS